jgi:hypothetical protein
MTMVYKAIPLYAMQALRASTTRAMKEAVSTYETSAKYTRPHGAVSQKTVFILVTM